MDSGAQGCSLYYDDLLNEFITLAEQKKLKESGKASKKVRLFFSRYNSLGVAYNMSQGVKKIRKKLDAIAINHNQFGFSVDSQSIRRRREGTCSYVYEGNIIGREDDVEKIVGLLVDSHVQQDVSFLTIVGGGLGKTALAQLVYNDARVKSAFSSRLWTCVSDHDQNQLNVEQILSQILASATGQKHEGSSKDWLQTQLREKLASNRYLLVLDDVWTENRNHWIKLVEFLLGDQRGSWIVVTTRSHETARVIGDEQSNPHDDFVKIGQEIVEGCARVPLAIRVAGSLLYGQDKSMWLSFQSIGLCNFKERKNDIMPVLKLSYQQLESPLKSCFAYCALFPKDFVIEKKLLLSLWMAQGYNVPLDDGQRMEDAAEEYFSILLRRCFFQDVEHDDYGEILSCKIHDLMHDIAQKVAGKEIVCIADSLTDFKDKKVRHLAHTNTSAHLFSTKNHIRSYLYVGKMATTLKLSRCHGLKELPKDLMKLINLQILDITGCYRPSYMPRGMSNLTCLYMLT
uniref:NB-ARC domain-containing protein n=1 Tax=Chenopodium quinoa TaxID=63459 RepID=A0A803LMD2_CHEQI